MPVHGSMPEETLQLVTRAGGSWWLGITQNQPSADDDTIDLADIPPLEVPRDATAWAAPAVGSVSHATGVTLPAATGDTSAAAWVLFDDEACTLPRISRWFTEPRDIGDGFELFLSPDVLTIDFTPDTFVL